MITPEQFLAIAQSWLGTAYHHQGRLKKSDSHKGGVDCIGLVVGICRELGMDEIVKADKTDYSPHPIGNRLALVAGDHLIKVALDHRKPADILLFKTFKDSQHIGILTEDNCFIHCNSSAGKVVQQPLSKTWERMITHVFRFKNF
ncbi:MAG: NlpC/P60 family protein [Pseudomonadota bacterium]